MQRYICDGCEVEMPVQNHVSVALHVNQPRVQKGAPGFDGDLCDACLGTMTKAIVAVLPVKRAPQKLAPLPPPGAIASPVQEAQ